MDGNIGADPRFVSLAYGDFQLRHDSPCIDNGDNSNTVLNSVGAFDLNIDIRIEYGSIDIGAYERQPGVGSFENPVIICVDGDNGLDTRSGYSTTPDWNNAKLTISAAIDHFAEIPADGLEIWVKGAVSPGVTYEEVLTLPSNVAIYGGFSGSESELEERDSELYITTVDADGLGQSVISIVNAGCDSNIVDGLTVINGSASYGGGFYIENSSPLIRDCLIVANSALRGGGVYCENTTANFLNCQFIANFCNGGAETGDGGALIGLSSLVEISDCYFSHNSSNDDGGAVYLDEASGIISNCDFYLNDALGTTADGDGGALYIDDPYSNGSNSSVTNSKFDQNDADDDGGAIYLSDSSSTISDCLLVYNEALGRGGALYLKEADAHISRTFIYDNSAIVSGGGIDIKAADPIIDNCVIVDNSSDDTGATQSVGGGISNRNGSDPTIVNCTIAENYSKSFGPGIHNEDTTSAPVVTNSIVWGNTSAVSGTPQIYSGSPIVTYSNVTEVWAGVGNISTDPKFVDISNGSILLASDSPCIDAGHSAAAFVGNSDVHQQIRIFGSSIDIGAFEYVDSDLDNLSDLFELYHSYTDIDYADTDLDGLSDYVEYDLASTDPNANTDSDSDGLSDDWENYLLLTLSHDGDDDPDGDLITNADEFMIGTDPSSAVDTDSDGIPDDWERFYFATLDFDEIADNDGDGIDNLTEFQMNFNPLEGDSDGNGVSDNASLWLKADAGVTTDGSGNVEKWEDQSTDSLQGTNIKDAEQTTATKRPALISGGLNGNPVLRFDGTDDNIISGINGDFQDFTLSWLIKPNTAIDYNNTIKTRSSGAWTSFVFHTADNNDIYVGSTPDPDFSERFNPNHIPNGTLGMEEWNLFTFTYGGGLAAFYKNGDLIAEKEVFTPPSSWTSLYLGTNTANTTIDGDLAEVIFLERSLGQGEVDSLAEYAESKYKVISDADADGLLDVWETSVLGNKAGDQTSDNDGDGALDYQDANPNDNTTGLLSVSVSFPADDPNGNNPL